MTPTQVLDMREQSAATRARRVARKAFALAAIRRDDLDRGTVALRFGCSLKRATEWIRESRKGAP